LRSRNPQAHGTNKNNNGGGEIKLAFHIEMLSIRNFDHFTVGKNSTRFRISNEISYHHDL
jgi:hypothetical protein